MAPDPRPLSVLVVESYPDGGETTAELLQLYGYRVTVARTGRAALRFAAADPPAVVLMELRLPDLDGCDVARELRAQAAPTGRRPLLVAVTGCGTEADRRRSDRAGIDLHLVKPVPPPVLVGVLERFRRVFAPCGGAAGAADPYTRSHS